MMVTITAFLSSFEMRSATATAPPELAATEIAVTPTTVSTAMPRAAPAGLPTGARLVITPSARRRARELGVDPTVVHGSGFGGAITLEDIERATVEAEMRDAREDLAEAKDDATRDRLEQAIAVGEAKIAVLDNPVY